MTDFEAPSFSLGLDFDLFDSEPQITHNRDPSSSNQFPVALETFEDRDDDFETLIADDSEPEYPDSHPKLHRLTTGATSLSSAAELHSTAVIDDEDIDLFSLQEDRFTDQHLHTQHHVVRTRSKLTSNDREPVSESCNNAVFPNLTASPLRGFKLTDSDSDYYESLNSNSNHRKQNVSIAQEDFPKAYRYFFHEDPRIQELVRVRLPNFSPLGNMLNIDLEQPGTSKIDYMGQFRFDESSKQAARTIKDKKSSTSRKKSRKLIEEMSQGWVNPKLGVDNVTTKGAVKRKVRATRQTAGHWLTCLDGKKVYVGKSGQELTGRVAYMQYKKESGSGFRKVKRKSVKKKK